MNRFLLSCAAAVLLAAPILSASTAEAATAKHRAKPHATSGRSVNKYTGYHGGDTAQGNAAVDQLNAQSLAAARGGAAPAPAR